MGGGSGHSPGVWVSKGVALGRAWTVESATSDRGAVGWARQEGPVEGAQEQGTACQTPARLSSACRRAAQPATGYRGGVATAQQPGQGSGSAG